MNPTTYYQRQLDREMKAKSEAEGMYCEVTAKGGHVGRRFYVRVALPIAVPNAAEAVAMAKRWSRLKRNHNDCILNLRRITRDEAERH